MLAIVTLGGCDQYQKPLTSLQVDHRSVYTGALSAEGDLAFIGSVLYGGSLWRLADEERLFSWNHAEGELSTLLASAFSDNGQWAATSDLSTLVLWNTADGQAERFWTAPGQITSVSLNGEGTLALLGLANDQAVVFHVQRGGILHNLPHGDAVNSVALSSDGRFGLTGSSDSSAKFWDLGTGEVITKIVHDDEVQLVALSPDDTLALSVSKYDKALLWRAKTGEIVGEIPLHAQHLKRGVRFTTARFSADNRQLLTGRPDGIVELWDIEALTKLAQWRLPKRKAWRPTGVAVIDVAFSDGTVDEAFDDGAINENVAGDESEGFARGGYYAIASDGFVHFLKAVQPEAIQDE